MHIWSINHQFYLLIKRKKKEMKIRCFDKTMSLLVSSQGRRLLKCKCMCKFQRNAKAVILCNFNVLFRMSIAKPRESKNS